MLSITPEMKELQKYWNFADEPEVVELKQQLIGGVINPIEYSHAILYLAERYGFTETK